MKKIILIVSIFCIVFSCKKDDTEDLKPKKDDTTTVRPATKYMQFEYPVTNVAQVVVDSAIESNKVIVVSLSGLDVANYTVQLFDATNQALKLYGGWYQDSRMSYFVTSKTKQKYTVKVTPVKNFVSYAIRVSVLDRLSPFSRLDSKGNQTTMYTYMMSNSPERLAANEKHLGNEGYYIVRSHLQGNANVYWEHFNCVGSDIKFGVLLWNKDSRAIKVTLNSSSAKSVLDAGSMENAMCGVWGHWFANELVDNDLSITNPIELPAYNSSNPSASAKWIFIKTAQKVPKGQDASFATFNGLINLTLTNSDGSLYSGNSLFCDTYAMTPGTESQVLANVANNDLAPTTDGLNGSGIGAMLQATIPAKTITPTNQYRFLITGFDPPSYQDGEKISTIQYYKNGTVKVIETCYGFCVVYRIDVAGFSSKYPVKMTVTSSSYTNPNAAAEPKWSGIYVAAKRARDGNVTTKLVWANTELEIDPNVPLNQATTYYLICSGMSSLPLEVRFKN